MEGGGSGGGGGGFYRARVFRVRAYARTRACYRCVMFHFKRLHCTVYTRRSCTAGPAENNGSRSREPPLKRREKSAPE